MASHDRGLIEIAVPKRPPSNYLRVIGVRAAS